MVSSLLSAEPVITRKVDKTSLLSYQANKYSVPQQWQSSTARVDEQDGQLITYRLDEHEEMARHNLSYEKGQIIKNRHHYRDYEQQLRTYEQAMGDLPGEVPSHALCALLRQNHPKTYRDQLRAALKLFQHALPQRLVRSR